MSGVSTGGQQCALHTGSPDLVIKSAESVLYRGAEGGIWGHGAWGRALCGGVRSDQKGAAIYGVLSLLRRGQH